MQQRFYDSISTETEKLQNLRNSHNAFMEQRKKEKSLKQRNPYINDEAAENEKREKMENEEEIRRDAEEKKLLVQAVINEANASGFPMPPSLVKLLQSNNGM